jgi:hypothetical protein
MRQRIRNIKNILPDKSGVPAESEFGAPGNIKLRPNLPRKIKIRAAHEVMAARATQLALLVDQFMPALRTPAPVLAGNVFVGRRGRPSG